MDLIPLSLTATAVILAATALETDSQVFAGLLHNHWNATGCLKPKTKVGFLSIGFTGVAMKF